MSRNNWLRWLMISGMVGAVGMGVKYGSGNANMKRMRRSASNVTSKIAREAGNLVSDFGDQIAKRMR